MASLPTAIDSSGKGRVIIDGTSYSGADIKVVFHVYDAASENRLANLYQELLDATTENAKIAISESIAQLEKEGGLYQTKVLAECQTLSMSSYREKYPVRALSFTYPKSFTRGPRTIAGSMVFTVFDKNVLYEILKADSSEFDADKVFSSAIIDQLPPLDITIAFANELGQSSKQMIYGVEFVSEGQVMSIHDLFIENTVQYVAQDYDPMVTDRDDRQKVLTPLNGVAASSLYKDIYAQEYIQSIDPFSRFRNRNNPFK